MAEKMSNSGKKKKVWGRRQHHYCLSDSLAAEADGRAGKIFIWKEGVQGHLVIRQLATEALT